MKKFKWVLGIKNAIIQYVKNNSKEFILVTIIFVIGIFVGVMFINNCSKDQEKEIVSFISGFVEKFKNIEKIDKPALLSNSVKYNVYLTLFMWLAGTTIIGIPVVLGIILFRGFCLGYTISAVTITLGKWKAILFCFLGLVLQNVLFIPALLVMGVSGIKLYKAIVNDRRRENIKLEIFRHFVVCLIMCVVMVFSSVVECEIVSFIFRLGIKYI